jgi:hypothetical protein
MFERQRQEAELRRLQRVKSAPTGDHALLGPEVVGFFKRSVARRQSSFGKVADAWQTLVPEPLVEHTALESFARGSLTVLVDSAAHLYELKQVLLAGLEQQLLLACRSSKLRRISLRQGRWYSGDEPANRKLRF